MFTKEILKNIASFLERAPTNGAKESYALVEVHSAVMDQIKKLEDTGKGEAN